MSFSIYNLLKIWCNQFLGAASQLRNRPDRWNINTIISQSKRQSPKCKVSRSFCYNKVTQNFLTDLQWQEIQLV